MKPLAALLLLLLCQTLSAQQSEALRKIGGHGGEVTGLLFSPDSRTLYTGSTDGLLRVWSPLERKLLRSIESGSGSITSMALSGNGDRLAIAGLDGVIRVWDTDDMRVVRTLRADLPANAIVMTPDGNSLVSAHPGGELLVWNVDSATISRRLVGHSADVNAIDLAPDGRTLASGASDFSIRLWDIESGVETKKVFMQGNDFTAVAFSPDGTKLVVNAGVPDAPDALKLTIFALPAMTGTSAPNAGHRAAILGLDFSPDSRFLASISEDYYLPGFIPGMTVVVSDLTGEKPLFRLQEGNPEQYARTLDFSPDGRFLAWGLASGIVRIYELGEPEDPGIFSNDRVTLTDHYASVRAVAITPGGEVAASSSDSTVRLFDAASGRPLARLAGHMLAVSALDFSTDAATLVSASADRTVRLWNVAARREQRMIYVSPESPATAVAFSLDGARIVVGLRTGDSTLGIWDTSSSDAVRMFAGHPDGVTDVEFSTDGSRIISAGDDGRLLVWDIATGEIEMTLLDGEDNRRITSIALSADGRVLAAGSSAGTIRTWSFPSGDPLVTFNGHSGPVSGVDISDDGSIIVSAGSDRTNRVWSLAEQREVHRYIEHPFEHLAIAVDSRSGRLLTGSADATLILWQLVTVSAVDGLPAPDRPAELAIRSLAPNPASGRTTIELEMVLPGRLEATIFNALGEKIATLHDGWLDAGIARFEWNTETVANGSYYIRAASQGTTATGMVVVRGE